MIQVSSFIFYFDLDSFTPSLFVWFSDFVEAWHLLFYKRNSAHSRVLDKLDWFEDPTWNRYVKCPYMLTVVLNRIYDSAGTISVILVVSFWGVKFTCQRWPLSLLLKIFVYSVTYKPPKDPFIFFHMWSIHIKNTLIPGKGKFYAHIILKIIRFFYNSVEIKYMEYDWSSGMFMSIISVVQDSNRKVWTSFFPKISPGLDKTEYEIMN